MTIVVNPTSQAGGGYESQRNSMKLRFRWFHPNVIWHVMHGFHGHSSYILSRNNMLITCTTAACGFWPWLRSLDANTEVDFEDMAARL